MELTINQQLKFFREKKNLNQKDLADALDITKSGYSLIESGKNRLRPNHLEILKEKFGFEPVETTEFITTNLTSDIENLRKENSFLRKEVEELTKTLRELSSSLSTMVQQKLGKYNSTELATVISMYQNEELMIAA